jgi:tetratricopeptide (TPR) repeat protein
MTAVPSEDLKARVATAQAWFDQKEFSAAVEAYGELRSIDPRNGFYADRYGFCFIALKQWREAERVWLEIMRDLGVSKGRINYVLQCQLETSRYDTAMDFARQHQATCALDPTFIVYNVTAALGCRDVEKAIDIFQGLEAACPTDRLPATHAQLGHRLLVLTRHGHDDAPITFIDQILPSVTDPAPLLDAGARLCAAAKRWSSQIAYLDRLIALEPSAPSRYLDKANALLALGDFASSDEVLADFAVRFPPALRIGNTEQRLQGLEIRARSMGVWRKTLEGFRPTQTFQGVAFRAAAHAALNQHPEAIEAAQSGLALCDNHPWFQFLLGKSHEALGDTTRALDWLIRATAAPEPPTEFLLALLRMRIKAGEPDAAANLGARLLRRAPLWSASSPILACTWSAWWSPRIKRGWTSPEARSAGSMAAIQAMSSIPWRRCRQRGAATSTSPVSMARANRWTAGRSSF